MNLNQNSTRWINCKGVTFDQYFPRPYIEPNIERKKTFRRKK